MTTSGKKLTGAQQTLAEEILDELLDLPPDQRADSLTARDIPDLEVRAELESLLRAVEASQLFLSRPAQLGFEEPDDVPSPGTLIGSWRILRLVGRGGMGIVCEAQRARGDFEQRAAIKILQRATPALAQRFETERQILARLEHPGIAHLLDGGVTNDGYPYMVMEFVEGLPITEYCRTRQVGLEKRLQLFLEVCAAVAYAHRNLVIHRDLKPNNVLVTDDGHIKLLDFGIAKLLDPLSDNLTQAAMVLLTPSCAAPEQLSGGSITTLTDVYALGLMLFQLLTDRHPWIDGEPPPLAHLRAAQQRLPPRPSRSTAADADAPVNPKRLRGDLDAIVFRALRLEANQRYPSVESLGRDVQRHLEGQPVEARANARFYVMSHTLRRYRWFVAGSLATIAALGVGLTVAAWQARQASLDRDAANRTAAREEALRYNLTSLFRNAISDNSAGGPATAKSMIDSSAQRVLREYREQPQLQGELVLALADLYGALEDVAGADSLLEGYVSEAEHSAATEQRILADARQKLANIELLRGQPARAATLLAPAEAYWARFPTAYAEERLEGLAVRIRLLRMEGDLEGSIAVARQAIEQRIALSGRNHRETAILFNSLAISLTAANRLPEALDAYRQTSAIYEAIGRDDTVDAQIIRANTGTLEMRLGHLREARALLEDAIRRERALAGDSAAVAAAMGQYGHVLSILGESDLAVTTLATAVDMAGRYTAPSGPLTLQNRIFLGVAQLDRGDHTDARATLESVREALSHQGGGANIALLLLRTRLELARVTAVKNVASGRNELESVRDGLRNLGEAGRPDLARALTYLGDLDLKADPERAISPLREAVITEESTASPAWEIAMTRERLAEALRLSAPEEARSLLRESLPVLTEQLGSSSAETIRAKASLARLPIVEGSS